MKNLRRIRAFSAMELLATVGMVGILGGISLTLIVGVSESAKKHKLEANVESLNQAITVYQSNGGQLATGISAQQVVSSLKTVGDAETKKTLPGYRGSFVDGRLIAVDVAASDAGHRAVWDSSGFRFAIADSGAGVRFELQDEATSDYGAEEARGTQTPGFAKSSEWVWDFTDVSPTNAGVATVMIENGIDPMATPTYRNPIQLAPPIFSIPGGSYPPADFPLTVTLSNPPTNPSGTPIKYSIDSAPWQIYNGTPIMVTADQAIVAYADSNGDSDYFSSFTSTNYYREDGSLLAFAGQSSGNFASAAGAAGMVTTYVNNGLNAGFEWGVGADGYTTGSIHTFNSDSFFDVNPESWFRLGGVEFFNSTIKLDSQATSVRLDITLNLTTPNIIETFGFELALENTRNLAGNTADQNADYVRIKNTSSAFSTSLNGKQYELQLQFGYLGASGFATVDQFHVHEGAGATADLWGYFAPVTEAGL